MAMTIKVQTFASLYQKPPKEWESSQREQWHWGVVLSFPCLRMFLPLLLTGAVELGKPPKAKRATRAPASRASADGADIPWVSCRLRGETLA
jgi:hypothetical protein